MRWTGPLSLAAATLVALLAASRSAAQDGAGERSAAGDAGGRDDGAGPAEDTAGEASASGEAAGSGAGDETAAGESGASGASAAASGVGDETGSGEAGASAAGPAGGGGAGAGSGEAPAGGNGTASGAASAAGASGAGTAAGPGTATGAADASDGRAGVAAGVGTGDDGEDGVKVPSGWRPLAELAGAIPPPASGAQVKIERRRGWGDPALGCFALLQRVSAPARGFHLGRTQAALVQAMQAAGFTPGPNGADIPFTGRGVQGRMRSSTQPLGQDRIAVDSLACFYNGREPDRCRPMCDAMLDSVGSGR